MEEQRLQRKKEELVKQWDLLTEKLSRLKRAKILETRSDEIFRLEQEIDTIEAERQQVEQELNDLEAKLLNRKEDVSRSLVETEEKQEAGVEKELAHEKEQEAGRKAKREQYRWDVFISHASEDKDEIVRPLVEALQQANLKVWYDEFSLKLGDSLRRSIDQGLRDSKFGLVILSPNFFAKEWTQRELDGLVAREISSGKIILPVWHDVSYEDILRFSPPLADKLAVSTSKGLDEIVRQVLNVFQTMPPPAKRESSQEVDKKAKLDHCLDEEKRLGEEFEFEIVTVDVRGEITHREKRRARQQIEDLGNGIILEMVYIPGGTFLMGSPETEKGHRDDESPQHEVTVAPFYMGKFPVTQEQWEVVMETNPSHYRGARRPVEHISWHDAVRFCTRLSLKTPRLYRLPSEAEWEYACRASTTTPFCFGETIISELANYQEYYLYASEPKGEHREETTNVERFRPNAFGLYDMHGNVCEWCYDPWHENYEGAPSDGTVWKSDGDDSRRLMRGGTYTYNPNGCRSASRAKLIQDSQNYFVGLRVVVGSSAWTL